MGMQRDRLRTTLRHLGIDASNYKVLKLLPLVYVSWTSGEISPERELRIVNLAHNHFGIGADGEKILKGWLRCRPEIAYFKEGLRDILLLALAPDEFDFQLDELQGLIAHAEAIARTTAAAMDAPTSVTPDEERALTTIAAELGVDDGRSWGALIRELGAESSPICNMRTATTLQEPPFPVRLP